MGLCQFVPGPASSQVGFTIGLLKAGPLGGLAAWTGFTLPSALLMLAFAYGHSRNRRRCRPVNGFDVNGIPGRS